MVELLAAAGSDQDAIGAASYLSDAQHKEKLAQLRKERDTWKDNASRDANAMPPESELTEVCLIIIKTMKLFTVCSYVCMFVCLYVCMFVCIFVCLYVCMFVCLYICMFLCLYVCMFVCLYVCMLVCLFVRFICKPKLRFLQLGKLFINNSN